MDFIRGLNVVSTPPTPITTGNAGWFSNPTDPYTGTVITFDWLNNVQQEFQNAIIAYANVANFVPGDNTQLKQCFDNVFAGIGKSASNFVPIKGGTMTGGTGLVIDVPTASLVTSSPATIGTQLIITSSNNNTGQGGFLDLQGGDYSAQTIGGVAYGAGVGTGVRIDTLAVPGYGNAVRFYKLNYTAGNPVIQFNTDTGVISTNDVFVTNQSTQLSVGSFIESIGSAGNVYIRAVAANNKNLYFMTSDPGTIDGAASGVIFQQGPTATSYANYMVFSANGNGSNGFSLSPIGDINIPTIISAPTGILSPGYVNQEAFTGNSGTWTVPANVYRVRATMIGGGGGGGGCYSSNANYMSGAGGGGGGFCRVDQAVSPGQVIYYTVGSGGAGGSYPNGIAAAGADGGQTTVYNFGYATGGSGGQWGNPGSAAGGAGGVGNAGLFFYGGYGSDGQNGTYLGFGNGGSSYYGGGGRAGAGGGISANCIGAGGGGAYDASGGQGGYGQNGLVLFEW